MIPTAEEIFRKNFTPGFAAMPPRIPKYIYDSMIEFAKLHVEKALKEASEKHKAELYIKGLYKGAKWIILKEGDNYNPLENSVMTKTDKKSILNAYPLDNIK